MAFQSLSSHYAERLRTDGYCIVPNAIPAEAVAGIGADLDPVFEATGRSEGPFYGNGTKRFGSMLRRSPHAAAFVQNELVLAVVGEILSPWCDRFQLNLTQAIEILPGAGIQPPHRDQDMWGGPKGEVEYLVNVMWPFTPYTRENGATRLWRGSHRRQDEIMMPEEEAIQAEMEPGSALLFLGSTLHGGSPNRTAQARRGMIVSYCLGWLKPYENQWLAYPPEVARHFPPELAKLVGYCQHRPNLGNVEGRCPSELLYGPASETTGARDELRPGQAELIDAWLRGDMAAIAELARAA